MQNGELVAQDQVEIDLDTEPGAGRSVDQSLRIDADVRDESVAMRWFRQQDLEEFAIANRRGDVQAGDVVERIPAMMNLVLQVERVVFKNSTLSLDALA